MTPGYFLSISFNHAGGSKNLKLEVARQASHKCEESKDSNEKELEAVRTESKCELLCNNIRPDGGLVSGTLGRSSQEGRNGLALFALKLRQTIIECKFTAGKLGLTIGRGSSVEGRVALDLEGWVREVRDSEVFGWCLVSSS